MSPECILDVCGLRQDGFDSINEFSSLWCQLDAVIKPNKELCAELLLQKFQLLGYRRLTDAQSLGRFSDIHVSCDAFKNLQLMECHRFLRRSIVRCLGTRALPRCEKTAI